MLLKVFILSIFLKNVLSHSAGAGLEACQDLRPRHGNLLPQITENPYIVIPGSNMIQSGDVINVMIQSNTGVNFRGFIIQARIFQLSAASEIVNSTAFQIDGIWEQTDGMQVMPCPGLIIGSVATHRSNDEKSSILLRWRSPQTISSGTVVAFFYFGIVQTGAVFWDNGVSAPILINSNQEGPTDPTLPTITPTPTPPTVTTTTTVTPTPPSQDFPSPYLGCGTTKLCFGWPNNCISSQNCQMFGAVFVNNQNRVYTFELFATPTVLPTVSYIAFALSDDNRMGRDLVTECEFRNNAVTGHSSFTIAANNIFGSPRLPQLDNTVRLVRGQVNEGRIHCFIERPNNVTTVDGATFDLNSKHYLLLAKGYSLGNNMVGPHGSLYRAVSDGPTLLTPGIVAAAGARPMTIAHGALMVIAWIGTAAIGIFIARFFKNSWIGRKVCGTEVWFFWHTFFQIITWILTIIAIILIFVDVGEWRTTTHSILGMIVMSFAILQPIVAIFRPKPTSSRRPIFNFVHKFFGNFTHILAFITIYFAVALPGADLVDWTIYIIIAFVAFYFLMQLILGIIDIFGQIEINKQKQKGVTNKSEPYSVAKKTLLGFFILTVLLFVIALVLLVSLPSPTSN